MSSYTEQVLNALTAFDTTLAGFGALVRTRPTSATVLGKDLDKLTGWANRAGAGRLAAALLLQHHRRHRGRHRRLPGPVAG